MLKKLVLKQLQVFEEQQYLFFRGQFLVDDKYFFDYCIGFNVFINVIMRFLEKLVSEEVYQFYFLWYYLRRVLVKYFGFQDIKVVLQVLRQEYEERLQRISLGDLEQLVRYFLIEEFLVEFVAEREFEVTISEFLDQEVEEKGKVDQ